MKWLLFLLGLLLYGVAGIIACVSLFLLIKGKLTKNQTNYQAIYL